MVDWGSIGRDVVTRIKHGGDLSPPGTPEWHNPLSSHFSNGGGSGGVRGAEGTVSIPPKENLPTSAKPQVGVPVGGIGSNPAAIYGLTQDVAGATLLLTGVRQPGPYRLDYKFQPTSVSVQDYLSAFYKNSPAEIGKMQTRLARAGFYGKNKFTKEKMDDNTLSALKSALVTAAQLSADGHTTLEDVLDGNAAGTAGGLGAADGSAVPFSGVKTERDVSYSSTGDASAQLQRAMSSLLGRTPTKTEVAHFHSILNSAEESHPVVTKATFVDGDRTAQTQTGGVDANDQEQMAQDDVYEHHGAEYAGVKTNSLTDAFERLIFGG